MTTETAKKSPAMIYQIGSNPLWTISALSAIIGEGVDGSSGKGTGSDTGFVTWRSRPGLKPSFCFLEWGDECCTVTVTPDVEPFRGNYAEDPLVQRIVGYCTLSSVPCRVSESLIIESWSK